MKKSISAPLIFLTFATLVAGFIWWKTQNQVITGKPCAFCNPQVLATHTFYQDSLVRGLCNHKPVQPGHCLAIIKRHIEKFEESTAEEISAIGNLLKKINLAVQKIYGPSSYMILQKNSPEVGQTVPHVHFHYIPKKKTGKRIISIFGLLWSFIITVFKKPIKKEELAKNVALMKREFKTI
jgi:diadenosine tetraphosphate (Ap4A) HIT family hydrolase